MHFKLNKEEIPFYILRFGLFIVFIYFGISQVLDQSKWIYLVPDSFLNFYIGPVLKSKLVFINGIFDIVIALSLISGFLLKIFSILGFIHLVSITIFSLGFEPSGIRDLGLAFAILSLFFYRVKNN
jgi:uncharacterized membrane protein YphA (DoxX/SURF4 family)